MKSAGVITKKCKNLNLEFSKSLLLFHEEPVSIQVNYKL